MSSKILSRSSVANSSFGTNFLKALLISCLLYFIPRIAFERVGIAPILSCLKLLNLNVIVSFIRTKVFNDRFFFIRNSSQPVLFHWTINMVKEREKIYANLRSLLIRNLLSELLNIQLFELL